MWQRKNVILGKTIFVIESFWVTFESIIFLENVSHILGKKRYLLSNLSGYFLLCKMSQSALTLSKKKQKKNHLYSRLRLSSLKYLCTWHKIVLDYFAYDISIVSLTPPSLHPQFDHCLPSCDPIVYYQPSDCLFVNCTHKSI